MMPQLGPALSAERPFPGLRPYDLADHAYFFGRREQVYALYRLTDSSRFVSVVGDSGSGKSSLVRAGLLPLLERENREAGGRQWRFISMRPGNAPLSALADALMSRLGSAETLEAMELRERIEFDLRLSSFGLATARAFKACRRLLAPANFLYQR